MRGLLPATLIASLFTVALTDPVRAGDLSFQPSLSANYDWLRAQPDSRPFADVDDWRRARVGFALRSGEQWQLRAEHDLSKRTAPELSLQWFLGNGRHLRFGQFKQPFLLDDVINERQTPLMEQSLATAFAISRRIGAEYGQSDDRHSFNVSMFGKRLDGRFEGFGMASRYSRVLRRWDGGLLHLGGSLALEDPRADSARFSTRPESGVATRSLADTGSFGGVAQLRRGALEFLMLQGPWSLQAEHALGQATRDGSDRFDSDASYVLLGFSPTGHARSYKSGVVGSPKFGAGERPWELFLRYSRIDLDDDGVQGGRQHDWNIGATWYLHANLRLMANYTFVDSRRRGVADAPELLQLRVQFTY
jgi:phosphate-selective porin OprO/OprP